MYASGTMDDTHKMLQAIINGQSAMKDELLTEIRKVDKRVDNLDQKVDRFHEDLSNRIDKIGLQLARLEDDTPTREEFDGLDGRVTTLEQANAPVYDTHFILCTE